MAGTRGGGGGGVAASTLRLYCTVHTILYYCPSRTITQLHGYTSAHLPTCTSSRVAVSLSGGLHRTLENTRLLPLWRTRIRLRAVQCSAVQAQAARLVQDPSGSPSGFPRLALGLTTMAGMIQQGTLDSALVLQHVSLCRSARPALVSP